jgi:CubicO group peptidase (beta-lactamase class C family)
MSGVMKKWIYLGMLLFLFTTPAGAKSPARFPVRDYWPTQDWKISTPKRHGLNAQILAKMRPHIEKELPQIRSVLIVRHGYLVYEQYFKTINREYKQDLASVTKSITSALVGIALKQGYLQDLDQKMTSFFLEYLTPETDPQVQDITLKHLLTMSSGFNKDDLYLKTTQEKLQQKPINEPGAIFDYDNDAADFLSPILIKTTHMSLLDFAKKQLFTPLGISDVIWEISSAPPFDKEPYQRASQGISLTTRDMAKFGYLYLNHGKWERKQIIPINYVRESTQTQIKTDDPTDYGYLWWIKPMAGQPCYFAFGMDGQYICVFHDLDIVVVITSEKEEVVNMNLDLIGRFIIPAVLK